MKVRLRIDFYKWQAGDVCELKDHSAVEFIRRGWAIKVETKVDKKPAQTETKETPKRKAK